MSKLINLIRPDLREFNPYSSARDEAFKGRIWLNANESPYPCPLPNESKINRYPEKQPAELKKLLASIYKVNDNQIVLSRGSDEVIDLLTRLFCRAEQEAIMICPPTFGMYAVCAHIQGAKVLEVPLKKAKGFTLDRAAIMSAWTPAVKIIFLCSPNNPTGNLLDQADIVYLCQQLQDKCIVVVDEAYVEFSDLPSLAALINDHDNLVVLRTLSKAYGLAGARCGVLLAQAELVQWILKIIPPYPFPLPAVQTIVQALTINRAALQQQVAVIKSERARLFDILHTLPFVVKVWPSEGNFLLLETTNAQKVMNHCGESGIIIRNMDNKPGLKNCVRISIGLPAENEQLLRVLNEIG